MRAWLLAHAAPMGPVYVNLDAEMQEAKLDDALPPLDVTRFLPKVASAPAAEDIVKATALLKDAARPVRRLRRTRGGDSVRISPHRGRRSRA